MHPKIQLTKHDISIAKEIAMKMWSHYLQPPQPMVLLLYGLDEALRRRGVEMGIDLPEDPKELEL